MVTHKAEMGALRKRALHKRPSDRVGTVENNHFNSCFGGRFQEKSHRSLVGVEAHPGVLQVNYHRVQALEHIERRAALRVAGAIDAIHGYVGGGIHRIPHVGSIKLTHRAMLRSKNRRQLHPRYLGEHIDGAAPLGVDSGLIGEHANAARSCILGARSRAA